MTQPSCFSCESVFLNGSFLYCGLGPHCRSTVLGPAAAERYTIGILFFLLCRYVWRLRYADQEGGPQNSGTVGDAWNCTTGEPQVSVRERRGSEMMAVARFNSS